MREDTMLLHRGRMLGMTSMLLFALACGGDTASPSAPPDQQDLFWRLRLNHQAVMLSTAQPYDTLTLVATPHNIYDEPLAGLPAPTYISTNPERVLVTPQGRLVAVAPTAVGTYVKVVAILTFDNVTHEDHVIVRVVDDPTPPVLTHFSIDPLPPDSAKIAAIRDGADQILLDTLLVQAVDAVGDPVEGALVSFRAEGYGPAYMSGTNKLYSGNKYVGIDEATGVVDGRVPGQTKVYATTTVFGVTKADTVLYRIGYPIFGTVTVMARPNGLPGSEMNVPRLVIGAGGVITWQASAADTTMDLEIIFEDPTHVMGLIGSPMESIATLASTVCSIFDFVISPEGMGEDCANGGNILLPVGIHVTGRRMIGVAARTFPVPGVYSYSSAAHGFQGQIIVLDESDS